MPLPDEKPRASVANLIGRFEQQNKRNSLTATSNASPSRSSSVVSNITGDSAKEEIKERRDWPPKSAAADKSSPLAPPAPIYASAFWSKAKPATADLLSDAASDPTDSLSNVSSEPPAKSEPLVEDTGSLGLPSSPTPQPQTLAAAAQSPRSIKTTARTTAKPAARSSMLPLKLQHTGQSTTASSSPKPKVAPSTPKSARSSGVSKTPSSIRPKTPASAAAGRPRTPATHSNRPKTPSSTLPASRPKTPSSGLFAPTAASLARARNGPPQPQVSTRKFTLSSAAAERLSKPTAASLSKARSMGAPVAQMKTITSARGGLTAAKGGAKLKTATLPSRKGVSSATTAKGVAPTVHEQTTNDHDNASHKEDQVIVTSEEEGQHTEELPEKHQEVVDEELTAQKYEINQEDVTEEANEEVYEGEFHEIGVRMEESHSEGEPLPELEAHSEAEHSEEPSSSEHEPTTLSRPSPTPSADHPEELSPNHNASSSVVEQETAPLGDNVDEAKEEIEHLVRLLELGKPQSIGGNTDDANIPDELDVHEIPDEE
ncbi:hypothetical protein DFH05DRAFT_1161462 [Lentinula detonsa]|uniref:Uncharacterized protein n=1 Tax=Lentinula detonsa TaxID=2804962 RepID=A0A9W8TXQ7_9AGAR|nr:hypothetical protein DFH05DRAFT_1161462 [Lentinula detonsa]